MKKKNLNEFIEESNNVHNSYYTYEKSIYINCKTHLIITCPKHGYFKQTPNKHIMGQGCPDCKGDKISKSKKSDLNYIIKKGELVYPDNIYDYSNIVYKNLRDVVELKCNKHNLLFKQVLTNHLTGYLGCECCKKENRKIFIPPHKKTKHEIVELIRKVHGDKYDLTLLEYIDNTKNMKLICPEHGIFERRLENINKGCIKCDRTLNFINKSKIIHGGFYKYDKVNYINSSSNVVIICPKHGDFNQKPHNHTMGKGCPICNMSHGEKAIYNYLTEYNISFEREKRFKGCKYKNTLPFDFYLPNHNICIEFDGKQHTESVDYFGGEEEFKKRIEKDNIKNEYCKNNNIRLIRLSHIDDIIIKIKEYIY